MKTTDNKAKATVKILDIDILRGTYTLMVGLNLKTITSDEYRQMQTIGLYWNSGLKRISWGLYMFNEANAMYGDGRAKAGMIRRILGL